MNEHDRKAIAEFVKLRDEAIRIAVMDGDVSLLRRINVYNFGVPDNYAILMAGACKACIQITTMPNDVKEKAKKWLIDHNFSLEVS